MTKIKMIFSCGVVVLCMVLQSCLSDDNDVPSTFPNALVTVKTNADGSTYFQLDENTKLYANNINKRLYDGKEVRALINYTVLNTDDTKNTKDIHVNWIDSIRTKELIHSLDGKIPDNIGDNSIEVINDWVTVLEDGYLTLRVRALWGIPYKTHYLNLISGINNKDPYEVELRHNANGDKGERLGDALIAFKLKGLDIKEGQILTLKWKSFDGSEKRTTFSVNKASSTSYSNIISHELLKTNIK